MFRSKFLRGEQDKEDIRDQYHQRFQAPGTTTEEEAEKAAHAHITTDKGEASDRYMGAYTGSIDSMNQSDNASDEGTEDVHNDHIDLNTTGYQTMESFSCEAIELQTFAQVCQPPNTDSDAASIGNVSEEAMARYLGRHTNSIDNASQSDTASDEAMEPKGFAQVHQPPNTESDAASIGNVSEDAMQRFLGERTGSVQGASQSDTASHEAIELQALVQVHLPPNIRGGKPPTRTLQCKF